MAVSVTSSPDSAPVDQMLLARTVTTVRLTPGILPVGKAVSAVTVTLSTLLGPPVMWSLGSVRANLVLGEGLVESAENCSGGIQRSNVMLVTVTLGESPASSATVPQDNVCV